MILAFQNCSDLAQFSSVRDLTANASTGSGAGGGGSNGGGYEGKPYIQRDLARLCGDGDEAKTRLLLNDGSFYLARKDCVNMERPYKKIEAEMVASGAVLFETRVLNEAAAESTHPRVVHFCRATPRSDEPLATIGVATSTMANTAEGTYTVTKSAVEIIQKDDGFALRGRFLAAAPNNVTSDTAFSTTEPIPVAVTGVSGESTSFEAAVGGQVYLKLQSQGLNSTLTGDGIAVEHSSPAGSASGYLAFVPDIAYACFTE